MPIYEYKCSACHKEFELIQKFSEPPLTECPECGGLVSKLISNTSFVLKGGGWYADGYGSASKDSGAKDTDSKPAAAEKPSADAAPADKAAPKADPAPKAEAKSEKASSTA